MIIYGFIYEPQLKICVAVVGLKNGAMLLVQLIMVHN